DVLYVCMYAPSANRRITCQRWRCIAVGADRLRAAISARLRGEGASDPAGAISPESAVRCAGIVVSCVRLHSVMFPPLPDHIVRLLYVMCSGAVVHSSVLFLGHECASQFARSSDIAEQPGRGKAEVWATIRCIGITTTISATTY